jgi:methyl-accepting chemotaxis protein
MNTLVDMQSALRRIVAQVRGASDALVNSSTEIAYGAVNLHALTEQSAANLEETASAMEEIAATAKSSSDTLTEATRLAGSNATAAEQGGRIIQEVMAIRQAINSASSCIVDLIGTIDGIAFQTNILALNAAVEAARAVGQGRGFAVVASEVRALALRSSAAAREIKALITDSVSQVEGGVRIAQQAGGSIGEVVSSAQRVRQLLADAAVSAPHDEAAHPSGGGWSKRRGRPPWPTTTAIQSRPACSGRCWPGAACKACPGRRTSSRR